MVDFFHDEVMDDMMTKTQLALNKFPFEKTFRILGYIVNLGG